MCSSAVPANPISSAGEAPGQPVLAEGVGVHPARGQSPRHLDVVGRLAKPAHNVQACVDGGGLNPVAQLMIDCFEQGVLARAGVQTPGAAKVGVQMPFRQEVRECHLEHRRGRASDDR